jgi:hypothetical protein
VSQLRVPGLGENGSFCEDRASSKSADWGLQMMNECSNGGFHIREAVTRNKAALLHQIKIDASFFALVREIDEKLLVTDPTRSMGKAKGSPCSYAAGRV